MTNLELLLIDDSYKALPKPAQEKLKEFIEAEELAEDVEVDLSHIQHALSLGNMYYFCDSVLGLHEILQSCYTDCVIGYCKTKEDSWNDFDSALDTLADFQSKLEGFPVEDSLFIYNHFEDSKRYKKDEWYIIVITVEE